MNQLIQQLIIKRALSNNYPKPGIVFLNMDPLFNEPWCKNMVVEAVCSAIRSQSFDSVAGIASRGYVFSGIIANHFTHIGEQFIQKVKTKNDPHFVQLDTTTEYSSDALQVLKNTIQKGKTYLLTDDLIATGGSVIAAIKLIRQCGGLVHTVFVMTELLDFAARNKLQAEGVELVSLLQFSNQDLQKLLVLQDCYAGRAHVPISYKLTHYAQGEQQLIQSLNASNLTVHLASQSAVKKEAAHLACTGMFAPLSIDFQEYAAQSGVNSQPLGDEETAKGANNRIEWLRDKTAYKDNSIQIAMENGIRYQEEDQSYYDFVHVIVKKGDKTCIHTQNCCKVPTDIINAIARNEDNRFKETWGETAKRLGIAKEANNPQQEACFGGVSRKQHLFNALCTTLGQFKAQVMQDSIAAAVELQHSIKRTITLKENATTELYAKKGILFKATSDTVPRRTIDLYNQGFRVNDCTNKERTVKNNDFKIFSTGDAFALLAPELEVRGARISIHVGVKHEFYSPLVLLHEALQLSRCVYEQGADELIIALPEQFHPLLYANDFNLLLLDLFQASGANRLYFYDKNYKGLWDEKNSNDVLLLTVGQQANPAQYQISKNDLSTYLHLPIISHTDAINRDRQVAHFMRKDYLNKAWLQMEQGQTNIVAHLFGHHLPARLEIPSVKAKPQIILCCSANKPLAEQIAAELRAHGQEVNICSVANSGDKVRIPNELDLCGSEVTIVQSTRPNPDNVRAVQEYQINGASAYFFEALLIARQAHLRGAKQINLINPYQFSARSDKAENNSKGKTGAYVQHNAMLLEAAGVNHVITAECHDAHTLSGSYTRQTMKGSAVAALSLISLQIANDWLANPHKRMNGQLRLVSPDTGATKRTNELSMQLHAILGEQLCASRILGEKQRDSHQDNSAQITSLNSGAVDINARDKYLITDDETATGSTLCQAIINLKKNGAQDISVVVVHNNMPLDWLQRQLCLARFLYLGVTDLHFCDTQEMGTLATSYADLIYRYASIAKLSLNEVEQQVVLWFKQNSMTHCFATSDERLSQELKLFKATCAHFATRIKVHSLAHEFAAKITSKCTPQVLTEIKKAEVTLSASSVNTYSASKGSLLFFPAVKPAERAEELPQKRAGCN